jgi:hypothetical protein
MVMVAEIVENLNKKVYYNLMAKLFFLLPSGSY